MLLVSPNHAKSSVNGFFNETVGFGVLVSLLTQIQEFLAISCKMTICLRMSAEGCVHRHAWT